MRGGGICPSIYKKSTSKPCRKLKFGILAYVNPTKINMRKKIGVTPINFLTT